MNLRFSLLAGAAIIFLAVASCFTVDVTEFAVVTYFGDPLSVEIEPGLKFRIPLLHQVRKFDARLQILEPAQAEFLTNDKKNVVVNWFAVWRIEDPLRYFRALPSEAAAKSQLSDIVSSELGAALAATAFDALINTDNDQRQLQSMVGGIEATLEEVASREFGIQLVEFDIRGLSFPDQNRRSVFERMRAERERIARGFRSEGEEEARKIRAQADREESRILSEAEKQAKILRGEGEAEATRIYGEAIARDPEFYEFVRTLEAYRQFLDGNTTLVLPSDSGLLRLLTEGLDDARTDGQRP